MTRGGREGWLVAEAFSGGDIAGGEAVSVAMLCLFIVSSSLVPTNMPLLPPPSC